MKYCRIEDGAQTGHFREKFCDVRRKLLVDIQTGPRLAGAEVRERERQ